MWTYQVQVWGHATNWEMHQMNTLCTAIGHRAYNYGVIWIIEYIWQVWEKFYQLYGHFDMLVVWYSIGRYNTPSYNMTAIQTQHYQLGDREM